MSRNLLLAIVLVALVLAALFSSLRLDPRRAETARTTYGLSSESALSGWAALARSVRRGASRSLPATVAGRQVFHPELASQLSIAPIELRSRPFESDNAALAASSAELDALRRRIAELEAKNAWLERRLRDARK